MLTLEQAIEHCHEKAEELKAKVPYKVFGDEWTQEEKECMECANEHEQLAEWLTELQERREADKWISIKTRPLTEEEKQNAIEKHGIEPYDLELMMSLRAS